MQEQTVAFNILTSSIQKLIDNINGEQVMKKKRVRANRKLWLRERPGEAEGRCEKSLEGL